jgi:hypothetical protein
MFSIVVLFLSCSAYYNKIEKTESEIMEIDVLKAEFQK